VKILVEPEYVRILVELEDVRILVITSWLVEALKQLLKKTRHSQGLGELR